MPRQARNRAVLARVRARRRSDGAAMFIVAMTLALLAAMGVYGLTATAYDVRAAGHGRAAAQAQHAADVAIQSTAYVVQTGNAVELLALMLHPPPSGQMKCLTAKPPLATDTDLNRFANACFAFDNNGLKTWAKSTSWPALDAPAPTPYVKDNFGAVNDYANMRIEFTNPVEVAPPAGYDSGQMFSLVRVTVRVEMRGLDAANKPTAPDTVAVGRGRLLIGPHPSY